jgi:hypothetical protein
MRFPQVSERVKEAPAHALRAVFASIGQVLLVTDRMKNKPAEEEQVTSPRTDEQAAGARPPAATGETAQAGQTEPGEESAPTAAAGTATVPATAGTASPRADPAPEPPGDAPPAEATAPETTAATPCETAVAEAPTAEAPTAEPSAAEPPAAGAPAPKAAAAETPAAKRGKRTGNVRLLPGSDDTAAAERAVPGAAGEATSPETGPPIPNYEQLTIASLRARLRGLTVVQVRELIVYERAHAGRPDVIAMFERRVTKLETPEG